MRIALGVHVSTFEVTASLVDADLPELGPVATRVVSVEAVPDGIGQAVATALGSTRIQALQSGLTVTGAAVVCENAMQCQMVIDAVAASEAQPLIVVDIFDSHLVDGLPPEVAAALLVGVLDPVSPARRTVASSGPRRGIWQVAAVGALMLAALGGVSALAMAVDPAVDSRTVIPADSIDTADTPYSTSTPTRDDSAPPAEVPQAAQNPVMNPAVKPEFVPPVGVSQPSAAGAERPRPNLPPAATIAPTPAPITTPVVTPTSPGGGVEPTDVEQPPVETSVEPTPEPTTTTIAPPSTTLEEPETPPE
ncbi:hypothetical protein E5720_08030 [Rhodococcus sp. PAMC28707]|uniref:hypothetical protein n=1 Tax=unclassified Rhodococcus (in: high G+C Gram-positive bacteria) TaxID=192944 RepID=UPI00109E20FF|nr:MULTISPECIES: hypothetical protein [unclassified Rhodococcus (in: high G+C Gram-positive bacteria)]QCB49842.1 hypothetical protein E5769_05985 [Rhodococcus sp. PAMC28705]QCB58465.1 hypothetical protein E5720_08030 [Rhodococcus sp. PAMC28707]